MRAITALASGAVFGLGLGVAQMIDPRKVLAFLDLAGAWDPSLLFVMGGAMLTAAIGFRLALRRGRPLLGPHFALRAEDRIDVRLLAGAAIFGLGWGLAGYCPGPAIASIGYGNSEALWFVPAMAAGAALHRWTLRRGSVDGAAPQRETPARS
ncbi:MAG: YeeE/YedE family protein [Burkholderiales bacterium]|nr:YeeE/YedE family protein [Burkholderiales bacterium]MDE2452783.1 YeeE/YedE family protein [Burkholderiales bacterium]